MKYPYRKFIEYLMVVQHRSNPKIAEFFHKCQFVSPQNKDLRAIKINIKHHLRSTAAKEAFRHGRDIAPTWVTKMGLDGITLDTMDQMLHIINVKEIKRMVEVMLLREIQLSSISQFIYEKYRQKISAKILKRYEYFFWNKGKMKFEDWLDYISAIEDLKERGIRLLALFRTPEYVKWKMGVRNELDPYVVLKAVMNEAYFRFIESTRLEDAKASMDWGKFSVYVASKLADYSQKSNLRSQLSSSRDDFFKQLELDSKEFYHPTLKEISKFSGKDAVDAEFTPLKELNGKKKTEEAQEIVEIPTVPVKKKKKNLKEIIDEPNWDSEDGEPPDDFY